MKKRKYSKELVKNLNQSSDKKQSVFKNKSLWGLFIIVVMIGSVFAFSAFYSVQDNNDNRIEYKGYVFINKGNGWETSFNGQVVSFLYSPLDVEDIPVLGININSNEVYFVIESLDIDENGYEIGRLKAFLGLKGINSYFGCLNEDNCGDYPIVNCNSNNVIIFRTSEKNSIYRAENGCNIIEGKNTEYMKVIDRFIYGIYGLM